MSTRVAFLVATCAIVACSEIVGIGSLPGAPDSGADAQSDTQTDTAPGGFCTNAQTVITSANEIDEITATNSFVFVQSFMVGLGRCANNGSTCTDPGSILNLAGGDAFEYAAVGSSIVYSAEGASQGSIHRTAFDGTNDTTIFATNGIVPSWVAIGGGSVTYWVNDILPAEVHCVGCAGSNDALWIENIQSPAALFADSNAVYVVGYDDTNVTYGIFGCSVQSACSTNPRVVIKGLPMTSVGPANVASDGARVYVPRSATDEIVSVDALGNVKPVVTNVQATALAVDAPSGELFYGTSDGTVARIKGDGSTASTTLSTCQAQILAVSFDSAKVYALVTTPDQQWVVFSMPR